MPSIVYQLTSPSGKSYIGVTAQSLQKRLLGHLGAKTIIGRALRKHGVEGFTAKVLLVGSQKYCFEMERKLIAAWGTIAPSGYNAVEGGKGLTPEYSAVLNSCPEKRARLIQRNKSERQRAFTAERNRTLEMRKAASEGQKKRWTKERREVQRKKMLQMREQPGFVEKLTKGMRPEKREAAAAAMSARWKDPTFRAKTVAAVRASNEGRGRK